MVRIVSSTHSRVKRFPQMLWLLLVSAVMAEADSGKADQTSVDADAIRLGTERLQAHLQSLPVAKGKVAPLLATRGNELKVLVNVAIAVVSVRNINDAQQTMTSSVSISLRWHDKALSWNTSDYDGIEMVEMPVDSVWTPHVYISNSLDKKKLLVVISHDGVVATFLDREVETMCNLNLEKYPYDTQNCPINIYDSHMLPGVELQVESYFFSQAWSESMSYSCEWYLETQKTETVSLNGIEIPCVSLKVRRKTMFYTVCLVLPMVLTSFRNTLVFLVPLQSGEKVSFLVSIFVSTSVFVSFFKDVMPRGLDSVPATMKLLIGVIIQSLLIVCTRFLFVLFPLYLCFPC